MNQQEKFKHYTAKIKNIVSWHDHCCYKKGQPCIARDGIEDEIYELLDTLIKNIKNNPQFIKEHP